MRNSSRIIIVVLLVASVTAVVLLKKKEGSLPSAVQIRPISELKKLPKLVDLGSDKCIPCKMMAPMLEGLREDYAEVFSVELIDVWKEPERTKKYGISIIPTQIFFDASGKELFRHEGYFPKEDILAKWKEFGIEPAKIE